jgi:hypothetical protein
MIDVLVKKGLEAEYINSFIKQFNSSLLSVDLINNIFLNRGVCQGKLCSQYCSIYI